ncbi:MAG: hypothetical protein GY853_01030 [PVC group bacterium]|nr:hypothetical protein [PVC group bacterium]
MEEIEELVAQNFYCTRADFYRTAIRDRLRYEIVKAKDRDALKIREKFGLTY